MRKGWKMEQLGAICENLDSNRKPITKKDRVAGSIPYYGATGILDYVKGHIFDEKLILLGEDGAKWKSGDECAFIISGKTWVNNHAHVLRPNRKIVLDEWLIYNLNFQDLSPYISGMTVPKLNQGRMNEIELPIPPLLEQKRIVAILDEAFAAIDQAKANVQKNLQNAKELFESYLQNVFANPGEDWKEMRLLDVCDLITDGTHFSPKNTSHGRYKYVTAKNIKPYYLDLSKMSYISEKDHKEIYSRCPVKKGDVLYIKDGATAGIAAINSLEEEFSLLSSVALLKPSSALLNTFLVHYMNSSLGKKNFLGYIDGAAITRLTLVKIKNVIVPVPTVKEQKKIVNQVDTLSLETKRLEEIYLQKLNDLEELKKSILQKAFSGELTS